MKARDLTELAVRNLREAVLRNALTTLGIAVGVSSLVAIVSLGLGLQALASKRLTSSGLFDAVFVTSPRGFGGSGGGPGGGGTLQTQHLLCEGLYDQNAARVQRSTIFWPEIAL